MTNNPKKAKIFAGLQTMNYFCRKQDTMDWKERLGIVYSTNADYEYTTSRAPEQETLPKNRQRLRIAIEKNHRGGKSVTIVRGFVGTHDDLTALARRLKTRLGVGGSAKEGEIIVQGDLRTRVIDILTSDGYTDVK